MGLEAADVQAITDRLHAEFERDLKALGITVLPTAQEKQRHQRVGRGSARAMFIERLRVRQ